MTDDAAQMRRALDVALGGWGHTAPNPLVGAVLVRDGVVVGEGFHARFGAEHAEVAALRVAGERARGATAYVTLEPCAHHGQTPPCADALIAAGVRRVVVATADPNPVAHGGLARLQAAGIETMVGVEEQAARELNAAFVHSFTSDRPWVTLKLAVSLDGALAGVGGSALWITGPAARREVHRLRAGTDAVAVGVGTVIADDPLLTVRDWPAPRVPPVRVVFDRHLRIPLTTRLIQTARDVPVIVVADAPFPGRAKALTDAGVDVVTAASTGDALRTLRDRGIRGLLVEGGARLAAAMLAGSMVDRLIIFQAPCILGAGAIGAFSYVPPRTPADAPRLPIVERRAFGDDLMTIYSCSPV